MSTEQTDPYYKDPVQSAWSTAFTFFFLSISVILGCIRFWLSIKQKSNLLNDAIISAIVLLSFHMCVYHGNIRLWRLTGIKYAEFFRFDTNINLYGSEHAHAHSYWTDRRMLEYMICVAVCLIFGLSKIGGNYVLLSVVFGITVRTIYSHRRDFSIIFSNPNPKSGTKFDVDVYFTDQLCSQVPGFRRFLYILCYFITFSFMKRDYGFYKTSKVHYWLSYVISSFPFVWRVFQCWWKYNNDSNDQREKLHDKSHLINMGKYIFAMSEAIVRVGYENDKTVVWLSLLVVISVIATVYQLYWDFAEDWNILQPEFGWLRNKLIVSKFYYYLAVVVNFVLRFGWTFEFILSRFISNDEDITLIVALVEVFRRGMWNFFRLENEEVKREKREREKREREEGSIDNTDQV